MIFLRLHTRQPGAGCEAEGCGGPLFINGLGLGGLLSNFVAREPRARGFFLSNYSHTIGSLGFARLSPHGRAITRLVRFCGVTLGLCLAVLSTRVLSVVSAAHAERVLAQSLRLWACRVVRLLSLNLQVVGRPPRAPTVLVANHLSYVDVLILASQMNAVFVAKAEVASWPVIGVLCRATQTIFLNRQRKRDLPRVIDTMATRLRQGRRVVFFPEGTSTSGAEVMPFKSSLFEAAVRAALPVASVTLHYQTPAGVPPASLAVCWWGDMTFARHFYTLLQLPRFEATLVFASEVLSGSHRKILARQAYVSVVQHFQPLLCPLPQFRTDETQRALDSSATKEVP